MPHQHIYSADGQRCGIVTYSHAYRFAGFSFTYSARLGPLKINKDYSESARTGRKFYAAFAHWMTLAPAISETFRLIN